MPKRREVTLGSLVQLVIRIVGLVGGALVAALQARTLSVADFGILSFVFSISAMAAVVSDLGMMNTAVRRLASSPDSRSQTISGLLTSRFLMGLLLWIFGVLASALFLNTQEALIAALLVMATLPLGALTATQAISQAELHFVVVNILLGLQNFLWLAAVAFLAWIQADLLQFAVAFLFCGIVQAGITWLLCGRGIDFRWKVGLQETLPLLRKALPIGVGSLAVTGYYRLTGIVLYAHAGPEVAGNFSAAFRILDALQAIPATLSAAFLPLMARYFAQNKISQATAVWNLALRLILTVSVLSAVAISLLSQPIVELLYGSKYQTAADLLALLMIAFPPVCLGWMLTGVVTATGHVKSYAVIAVSVAILSISASLLVIPLFGAPGASLVTIGTELLVMTALSVVVYRDTGLLVSWSLALKISLAAALTAVSILLVRPYGLFAGAAAAAVTGTCSVVALRVLRIEDIRKLLQKGETFG